MSDQREKRTYREILESFIDELNDKGANLDYMQLSEAEKLELIEILIEQCNEHMRPFVVHVLGYDWRWFHEEWFNAFIKYDVLCIVASRGLGKSFFFTQMLNVYLNFIQKNYKSIVSSFNEKATFDFLKDIRTDIEDNELLSSKIPEEKSSDWNKGNLDFRNKSNIKGISITSQIRRVHVNYFICDDILNDDVELSPEEIKKKVYATIIPTLEIRKGKFVLIGTKFAEDDIFTFLKEKAREEDSYHYIETRTELDEKEEKTYIIMEDENGIVGKQEDKEIYSYRRLLSIKNVEPIYFSREYSCEIVANKEAPFPIDILMDSRDKELSYEEYADSKRLYRGGLDFSVSTAKDSDDTVLMHGYLDEDKNIVIANIFADNKMEVPARTEALRNTMNNFKRSPVLAEKNSMGQTNIENINKDNYQLIAFHTSRTSKIDVTEFASRLVKDKKLRLPYKKPRDQIITDKLIQQLAGVKEKKTRQGMRSYTGSTKHDDYYIAFILMVKQLMEGSGPMKIRAYKREDLLY